MKNLIEVVAVIGILFSNTLFAQNTSPVVSNVNFSLTGTTVTVTYDISDAEHNSFTIMMEVSDDGGVTWDYNYGTANGAIGASVTEGTGKTITWTYSGEYNPNFKVRIIADDLVGDQIYYSGQIYNTVTIGTQTWLKENLNVGTMINSTTSGSQQTDNSVIEKYCYDNDPANCEVYGGLYQWDEAMQYVTTANAQGICPPGWHIPIPAIFQSLQTLTGDKSATLIDESQTLTYTPVYTQPPPYHERNGTEFSALFAGRRFFTDGSFIDLAYAAYFWGSSEFDTDRAISMFLYNNESSIYPTMVVKKTNGFSVRCVKN